jgi:Mrp family chromosome partitioning ATPase
VSANDPQIPIVELLPAFEEETGLHVRPRAATQAAFDERTPQGAQLRALAGRVRALNRDKRVRRIGVVGSVADEGTTTVALGLSRALGTTPGQRVLFLELDFANPAADRALRIAPPATGVARFLAGHSEIPVLRHPAPGFWVLSAGPMKSPPLHFSEVSRLPRLLSAADRVFDFVIGDLPPLLPDRDGLHLQEHFDGFLFVVRARHAAIETIERAAHMLRPGQVLGFVLNFAHDRTVH